MNLIFSTGNAQKFAKGQQVCSEYGLLLVQQDMDVDEVQSEDPGYVALKKAEAVFSNLKQPVIISDDAWEIYGLNGFPGTYAHSVNKWFTADDYLRLTRDLADRRVSLRQTLVYQDNSQQKSFVKVSEGTLLKEVRGTAGVSIQKVVALGLNGTASISEVIGDGTHYTGAETLEVWHDFAKWFTEQKV